MNDEATVQYKCGICKWFINTHCENLQSHQCFSTFDEAFHEFIIDDNLHICMVLENPELSQSNVEGTLGKLRWTHEALLNLIYIFKKYVTNFQSTTERNDKVWGRLSNELIQNGFNYTPNQCEFKFKYLKSKYLQEKDNMKHTSTGAACIQFQYYTEMDDIFGSKPNVNSVSLASNLVQREINADLEDEILKSGGQSANPVNKHETLRKKFKKSTVQQLLSEIRVDASAREEARNQRHKENLEFKYKLLKQMDDLINVLKK